MAGERKLNGYTASPGFVSGPLAVLSEEVSPPVLEQGTPQEEKDRLVGALEAAAGDLWTLSERLEDEDAAGIVEFQAAMLEDETLSEPALSAIDRGAAAAPAWQAAMEDQIADYQASDDPYFTARVSDLADMRDRVLRRLSGVEEVSIPTGSIVVAEDFSPTRFLTTDWTGTGLALFGSSPTSHLAILARARGVPMIVGMSRPDGLADGPALLDAAAGTLILSPGAESTRNFDARRAAAEQRAGQNQSFVGKPAVAPDGRQVPIHINIADPDALDALDVTHCDGIGLVRTEFMFMGNAHPPDENAQYDAYRRMVSWAEGRPVTLRTLDAGGDKPIPGITVDGESNPFLGVRGLRLSLRNPDLFKIQLRAMLRASAHGPVKIMVPMVTAPQEMAAVRDLVAEAAAEVSEQGHDTGTYQVGMMVEVPAAALTVEDFDCDFFSIGSNDLVQYTTACGRDVAGLNHLTAPDGKAVLRLIGMVAANGAARGLEVSVCGDMAGDPRFTKALLDCGVSTLSMSPNAIAGVKGEIARMKGADA